MNILLKICINIYYQDEFLITSAASGELEEYSWIGMRERRSYAIRLTKNN